LNPDERLVLLKALSVMRQAKLEEADDCTEALNKLVHHYRQIVDSGRELTQEEKQFLFEAKELLPPKVEIDDEEATSSGGAAIGSGGAEASTRKETHQTMMKCERHLSGNRGITEK
jgi:hypothetical protein